VSGEDVEVAKRFRAASRATRETGDREDFCAFFADDVEYTSLWGTFRGLRELRENLYWATGEPNGLDVELTQGEWQDLGGGRVASESLRVERWKETGEVATTMRINDDLRIRDGKITRFERHVQPE
jgi:ketosteroid isomerase-like protein